VAGIIASSAYAFTATITVNSSNAGDGPGSVAALPAVTPSYTLDSSGKIASVVLTFASPGVLYSSTSGAASTLVKFSYGGTWSNACTAASAGLQTRWTCTFTTNPSVSSVTADEVVGVDTLNP
jgi:uncharacterized protein RhaS with RHS repeats